MVDFKTILKGETNSYVYPTKEEVSILLSAGWSILQSVLGFEIFDYNGYNLLGVESIGELNCDDVAAKEAKELDIVRLFQLMNYLTISILMVMMHVILVG